MCINACLPWKMIFASEQLGARGGRPLGGPAARPAPASPGRPACGGEAAGPRAPQAACWQKLYPAG
ncbi:MAG: hypothetical protein DBY09_06010 [Selenomonadales bacterium]|nr:MAG: hypothetical protein DBY09_06010 [Selenomonadales bacterium]